MNDASLRTPLWVYALLAFVATAGFFYVNIMSAIVDGMTTGWGFTSAQAGTVAAANIYGGSAGALAAAFIVRRVRWRPTLAVLLLLLLIADLASMIAREPMILAIVRTGHGLVGGMAVGVSYSVMARTNSPDRAFGMLLLVQFGLGGLGVMTLPPLVPTYGAQIMFVVLVAFSLLSLIALPLLPRFERGSGAATQQRQALSPGKRKVAFMGLAAIFLFQAGNMALNAFLIPLGESFGLARDFVSSTLGWATWIGALGAVLVIVMGTPRSRLLPLIISFVVTLVGIAAFYWSAIAAIFFLANVATAITWSFVVPHLFGMLSQLDETGGMTTMAGFLSKIGLATGPLVAGWVLSLADNNALITAALVMLVLAAVATLMSAFAVDYKETEYEQLVTE